MEALSFRSAQLADPACSEIQEGAFVSKYDGKRQTYLLKDFRSGPEHLPLLVIYLHGAASHQDQGLTAGIYQNAFGRLTEELSRRSAVYVCPEYRGGSWMGPAAEADMVQLLAALRGQYRPDKVILIGGSMGGTSALIYAVRHVDDMDGVLVLCPATEVAAMFDPFSEQFCASYGGSPAEVPELYQERSVRHHFSALAQMPVFLSHGTADALIPVAHSRWLNKALRQLGAPVRYEEIFGGDHDAPLAVDWREAFDFLLNSRSS